MRTCYVLRVYAAMGETLYVVTEYLKIIPVSRIHNMVSKGPKYRFLSHIDCNRCREEITSALNDLVIDGVNERVLSVMP